MRIALDVMGGDHAPQVCIEGAILAAKELPDVQIVLVGPQELIAAELAKHAGAPTFEVVHATEVIEMTDKPANAVRQKKDSTMVVGMKLLKEKKVDGFFSAGNTGGMLAAGIFTLGRIKGIERPALSTIFPTMRGHIFLLDIGANADVKPEYLQQFALMGSIYAERVMKKPNPTVAILSNGEEEGKGSTTVLEAYKLIQQLPINFKGNAEGRDLGKGTFDVIVTDGFTGNVVIKTAEGLSEMTKHLLRESFKGDPISMVAGALFMPWGYPRVKKATSADEIGGAPLLGLNGVALVGHGSSSGYAIRSGILSTKKAIDGNIVSAIEDGMAALKSSQPTAEPTPQG
jgi:glycerol-3-phosphate acyltransferase PlsX